MVFRFNYCGVLSTIRQTYAYNLGNITAFVFATITRSTACFGVPSTRFPYMMKIQLVVSLELLYLKVIYPNGTATDIKLHLLSRQTFDKLNAEIQTIMERRKDSARDETYIDFRNFMLFREANMPSSSRAVCHAEAFCIHSRKRIS